LDLLLTSACEQRVRERVETMTGEMVEFLRGLVRVPTINPPGDNYAACAEFIARQLREFGYATELIAARGRPEHTERYPRINVVGRMEGSAARPLVHFNGHFDVVPAGEGWTVDPFAGVVREGRIYGRGVTDQKAGIAASIFAVEAIRREGVALRGTVEQSATVDEESGGFAGMGYLAERGYVARDRTDYVIITEPLGVDRICLGHRGVYWFRVTAHGQSAHGSMPFLGANAIAGMAEAIAALERRLQPRLAMRRTAQPVEPLEARHPSLNINSIHGGQPGGIQTPCVADRCEAVFDRRFLAEEPVEMVKEEIAHLIGEIAAADPRVGFSIDELMTVLPCHTEPDSPLVDTLRGAIATVTGFAPPLVLSPGTYDQKHVMRLGLVEQCVAYGPGILELSHQPDEYCRVDHLVQAAQAMALATMRLAA
jgi:succinyl-diaminopimelate desuccinylase